MSDTFPPPPFAGFGPGAFAFLTDLAREMNAAWMRENRDRYETELREPMAALVEALTEELRQRGIALRGDAKQSLFRLNRDIRFSADKRPYKTHAGAVLTRDGTKKSAGLLYIHIDPAGSFAASGFYHPEPPQLGAIRAAIRDEPEAFAEVLAQLRAHRLTLSAEDSLTRLPRGFEALAGTPGEDAVKLRSFVVRRELTAASLRGRALVGRLADFAAHALPLLEFGWRALDSGRGRR
jgi:uncharacterized protein (TIGR02453 family)